MLDFKNILSPIKNNSILVLVAVALAIGSCSNSTGSDDKDIYGVWTDEAASSDAYVSISEDTWIEVYYYEPDACYEFDEINIVSISDGQITVSDEGSSMTFDYELNDGKLTFDFGEGGEGYLVRSDQDIDALNPHCS